MVFGWGKKKSVEEPVERASVNQNISLEDVPGIISDLIKLRESQTLSEIKTLRNKLVLSESLIFRKNVIKPDECIKELIEYFKIDVKDVFVFHDDMDIDLGKIKVKFGGSSAGHNGIESIDKNIGKNYSRVRIGIGRPKNNSTGADHVLDNFSNEEMDNVQNVTKNIIESLSILINKDLDLFSSKINQN